MKKLVWIVGTGHRNSHRSINCDIIAHALVAYLIMIGKEVLKTHFFKSRIKVCVHILWPEIESYLGFSHQIDNLTCVQ